MCSGSPVRAFQGEVGLRCVFDQLRLQGEPEQLTTLNHELAYRQWPIQAQHCRQFHAPLRGKDATRGEYHLGNSLPDLRFHLLNLGN
ncbi:hypothetical protein D3C71_1736870 [compost metagenome]